MRIYGKNEVGEVVYIADCPLPRGVCDGLYSGHSVQYELPPVLGFGSDKDSDFVATTAIERILLEPYRLYRNRVLVEIGAMIADSLHVKMLAENIRQRVSGREEWQAISDACASCAQGRE
ncbi:hypothetical protein [Aeromonas salmonicida]|uniref:hypothetical protein n=1 Tax=Aeromonas salmonicida TaxID=645 RepID=UPI001F2B3CDD|nr:hypothetical protein [Aeromonas salmonicida]MCE9935530.1 hypothetical protein [Aeromonas salmonicida]